MFILMFNVRIFPLLTIFQHARFSFFCKFFILDVGSAVIFFLKNSVVK